MPVVTVVVPVSRQIQLVQHFLHLGAEIRIVDVEQEIAVDVGRRELLIDFVVAEMKFEIRGGVLVDVENG